MSTQPPNRLEELEKAFALFKQSSEAFERKYRAFEQDLRAQIEGLNHYVTITLVLAQMQEIDIREIKSTLSEHGRMLERILSLLEPKS
jgi:hypothetical protein